MKKMKGGTNMTLMHALATSLWQEVESVVDAFLIVYRAEIT